MVCISDILGRREWRFRSQKTSSADGMQEVSCHRTSLVPATCARVHENSRLLQELALVQQEIDFFLHGFETEADTARPIMHMVES